jgi:hypothetical protein
LPKIKGTFGCAVPAYHARFANGVFSGTDFGDKSGIVTNGADRNGIIYGYRIEFGNNQHHSNVAPCVSCFCWRRTA